MEMLAGPKRLCVGRMKKNEGFSSENKGNVTAFGLNTATFPMAYKFDIATLKSNVAMFQGGLQLTSRC